MAKAILQVTIVYDSKSTRCNTGCGMDWSSAEAIALAKEGIKQRFGDRVTLDHLDLSKSGANLEFSQLVKKDDLSLPALFINGQPRISGEFDIRLMLDAIEAESEIKTGVRLMDSPGYELIIVGGGPAGLSAGIYSARARLNTLLIEKGAFGGQIINAEAVENYPGFPDGISGYELGELMHKQAVKFGLKTLLAEVTGLEVQGDQKIVKTTEGNFTAKAVIICGGSDRQKLGVSGEKEFTGRGVSYCATCDGAFFQDQPVAVVGGGDAAIMEALHLTKFASKVVMIHRRDQLRATKIMQEKAFAQPKIEFIWNSIVEEVKGEDFVKRLKLNNVKTGEKSLLDVSGVFISVGLQPNTGYIKDILKLDPYGYIITNNRLETNITGIFAAGDIRYESARQSITAAGDGATAAIYAGRFISD